MHVEFDQKRFKGQLKGNTLTITACSKDGGKLSLAETTDGVALKLGRVKHPLTLTGCKITSHQLKKGGVLIITLEKVTAKAA